ncbi:uncharacterized protein LOC143543390 isoform X4 [Bidens hawaiensis]|uniref:uncharacterized protein LOC143543390 isoform X4 n=1 Tax=Bidens hawaiensis TaxID=980011 RepID=UPI00404B7204
MTNYDHVISELSICRAALLDDWNSASPYFKREPDLMTKQITFTLETPLIIAVGTNCSHHFVQKLVESIVAIGATDKMSAANDEGYTPLHYAAKVGNTIDAKLLVQHDPGMTRVLSFCHNTPLKLAAWNGNKETLRYLLTVTHDLPPGEEGISPYTGVAGGDLITLTIMAGFYDVALEIINKYPNIVLEHDRNGDTALQMLAKKPDAFSSGSRLGFWGGFIYYLMIKGTT